MARETVDMSFGEATGPVDWDGLVSMPRPPRLQCSMRAHFTTSSVLNGAIDNTSPLEA